MSEATQKLENLNTAVRNALIQRAGLYDNMEGSDKNISALQNTIAGVALGREIAAEEVEAARVAAAALEEVPETTPDTPPE